MKGEMPGSSRSLLLAGVVSVALLAGCRPGGDSQSVESGNSSNVLVTDVRHSSVKRQSIGNCWLYAKASWAESLHLSATGEEVNISESYWTWWHWHDQLVNSWTDSINTGGWWFTSVDIVVRHGLVFEGEFIPGEADAQMSATQSRAEAIVNAALGAGGELERHESRTPENVRRVLDAAFGVNMAAVEAIARKAEDFVVGNAADGTTISLRDAVAGGADRRWRVAYFPKVWGKDTPLQRGVKKARKELLQRVLKAMNDRHPVVMSLMIDFSALDIEDQTFKASTLAAAGGPGRQGGHMVVLEDYVVTHVPGYGTLGEGDLPDEQKQAALLGRIKYFKTKNSWGTDRPDRGLTDGYTRFDWKYMTSQLAWKNSEDSEPDDVSWYTTLSDFVLPPGY